MSNTEDHQVFHVGTFRRCDLCFGDIITDASAHSWTSASTRPLDTSFADGTDRHQPGFATNTTASSIATLPPCSASFTAQSGKLDFPQCYQRKSATLRTQDFAKDKTEKHIPTDCDC
jgi:hypothetical protein